MLGGGALQGPSRALAQTEHVRDVQGRAGQPQSGTEEPNQDLSCQQVLTGVDGAKALIQVSIRGTWKLHSLVGERGRDRNGGSSSRVRPFPGAPILPSSSCRGPFTLMGLTFFRPSPNTPDPPHLCMEGPSSLPAFSSFLKLILEKGF